MKSPKARESGLQRLDRSFLCADCHSAHGVHRADNPKSWIHRSNISHTCGKCHATVDDLYEKSIHGRLLAERDERAPVCTDCHTTHSITRTETPAFMLDIVNECGDCHNDPKRAKRGAETYYLTYRASYHGQVTELGATRAARCSDCHGAHDILPVANVASRVHENNLIKTCSQAGCHPSANSNFVQFAPHADHRDGRNYPILHGVFIYFMIVMSSVFVFFGLHTLLWLIRSSIERVRCGPRPRHTEGPMVRRFSKLDRVNHALMALSTLALTATGFPLLFADNAWAQPLAELFGGIMTAGVWHRTFALLLIINLLIHFIGIAVSMSRRRGTLRSWIFGPHSIAPSWQDVKDCLAMFRWFVRMGPKPRFGRWTYWEKFDYWCAVAGTLIVTASGLLLWFPAAVSIFLPGWLFNVAMIVHGFEALLAIGFTYTIHFFNSNLRVEKFPADPVIFTGRVSVEELKEERPKEHEYLVASGLMEECRVRAWPRARQNAWVAAGILAMLVGLALLTLIIMAGLGLLQEAGITG